ncbi:MAG: hypothetical protein HZA93_11890 [Verrucomicrobia bacterium]|nr:hypothetical protein [Verrucomicrobiota bacterium]
MRPIRLSRVSVSSTFVLAGLFAGGCATTNPPTNGTSAAVVEGEAVYPTGSRISRVVKKGDAAGIAKDMPGGSTGTNNLEREANDFRPQAPITGR